MNHTEYFTEKIATLPEDLQRAIFASDYEKTLSDIQREYKLHIDQGQVLETLVTQLMFGDIDAPQFINRMFNEAHVSSSVAGDILLKIDMLILKKIRTEIEDMEEVRRNDKELERLLMDDEELAQEEKSELFANYYKRGEEIAGEIETELLAEGILPDGSNITDEMLAKELGTTVEELKKRSKPIEKGGLREARDWGATQSFTPDLLSEKEELLKELEAPEKSFIAPLFVKKERTQTPPDHQLQNTHIELPYIEEIVPEITEVVEKQPTPAPETPKSTEPVFKKPTKITLSIDPYKEPIE